MRPPSRPTTLWLAGCHYPLPAVHVEVIGEIVHNGSPSRPDWALSLLTDRLII